MKKNLKTKSLIAMIIMGIVIAANTITLAADYSAAMSLTSSSKLQEGGTVTVNVNLTIINAGDGLDTI